MERRDLMSPAGFAQDATPCDLTQAPGIESPHTMVQIPFTLSARLQGSSAVSYIESTKDVVR